MQYAIKMKDVTKTLGDFKIDLKNLRIPKGYITGFIGPNGAGKSTTIKLIMDLIKADTGQIDLLGYDHENEGKAARERIGFVYAENIYYENLNVCSIGNLVNIFYPKWDKDKFDSLCRDFKLPLQKKVKDLSTGMKVKLSLAVALSHNADLIILDEPTSGLDPVVRLEILDLLYDIIQDQEKTILFSTHILADLEKIADYIIFINDGRLLIQDSKNYLLENYNLIKGPLQLLDSEMRNLLIGYTERESGFAGLSEDAKIFQEIYGDKVLIEPASLEDIMIYHLKGDN